MGGATNAGGCDGGAEADSAPILRRFASDAASASIGRACPDRELDKAAATEVEDHDAAAAPAAGGKKGEVVAAAAKAGSLVVAI